MKQLSVEGTPEVKSNCDIHNAILCYENVCLTKFKELLRMTCVIHFYKGYLGHGGAPCGGQGNAPWWSPLVELMVEPPGGNGFRHYLVAIENNSI